MNPWQRLSTKKVYENPWMTIWEDQVIRPDGQPGIYGWAEPGSAAVIVPVDEDGRIQLIRQLRYTTGRSNWELPMGGTDGQKPLEAAQRELAEEAGLTASQWEDVGEYESCVSLILQTVTVFVARGLASVDTTVQAEEGITDCRPFTLKEIRELIAMGEFTDGQSLASLMLALPHLS